MKGKNRRRSCGGAKRRKPKKIIVGVNRRGVRRRVVNHRGGKSWINKNFGFILKPYKVVGNAFKNATCALDPTGAYCQGATLMQGLQNKLY